MTRTAHATLLEKEASAIALHAAGRNFEEIATELGYSNRSGAWKVVTRALNAERNARAGDFLQLQVDRYEAVLSAHWQAATVSGVRT